MPPENSQRQQFAHFLPSARLEVPSSRHENTKLYATHAFLPLKCMPYFCHWPGSSQNGQYDRYYIVSSLLEDVLLYIQDVPKNSCCSFIFDWNEGSCEMEPWKIFCLGCLACHAWLPFKCQTFSLEDSMLNPKITFSALLNLLNTLKASCTLLLTNLVGCVM